MVALEPDDAPPSPVLLPVGPPVTGSVEAAADEEAPPSPILLPVASTTQGSVRSTLDAEATLLQARLRHEPDDRASQMTLPQLRHRSAPDRAAGAATQVINVDNDNEAEGEDEDEDEAPAQPTLLYSAPRAHSPPPTTAPADAIYRNRRSEGGTHAAAALGARRHRDAVDDEGSGDDRVYNPYGDDRVYDPYGGDDRPPRRRRPWYAEDDDEDEDAGGGGMDPATAMNLAIAMMMGLAAPRADAYNYRGPRIGFQPRPVRQGPLVPRTHPPQPAAAPLDDFLDAANAANGDRVAPIGARSVLFSDRDLGTDGRAPGERTLLKPRPRAIPYLAPPSATRPAAAAAAVAGPLAAPALLPPPVTALGAARRAAAAAAAAAAASDGERSDEGRDRARRKERRLLAQPTVTIPSLLELCKALMVEHLELVESLQGLGDLSRELLMRGLPAPGRPVPLHIFRLHADCFPGLTALDLSNRARLPWDHLRAMSASLTTLALDNARVDAADLGVLARCPQLRWLSLAHNHLADLGHLARPFGDPAQRGTLCRLEFLDLSFNVLADRAVHLILPLHIGTVVLTGNPLTKLSTSRARELGYRVAVRDLDASDASGRRLHGRGSSVLGTHPAWPANAAEVVAGRADDLLAKTLLNELDRLAERAPPAPRPDHLYQEVTLHLGIAVAPPPPPPPAATASHRRPLQPRRLLQNVAAAVDKPTRIDPKQLSLDALLKNKRLFA